MAMDELDLVAKSQKGEFVGCRARQGQASGSSGPAAGSPAPADIRGILAPRDSGDARHQRGSEQSQFFPRYRRPAEISRVASPLIWHKLISSLWTITLKLRRSFASSWSRSRSSAAGKSNSGNCSPV